MKDQILKELIQKVAEQDLRHQQEIVSELYNDCYNRCRVAYIEAKQLMEHRERVLQDFPYKPANSQFNNENVSPIKPPKDEV